MILTIYDVKDLHKEIYSHTDPSSKERQDNEAVEELYQRFKSQLKEGTPDDKAKRLFKREFQQLVLLLTPREEEAEVIDQPEEPLPSSVTQIDLSKE